MEKVFALYRFPDCLHGFQPYFISGCGDKLGVIIDANVDGYQEISEDEAVRIAGPKLTDDLRSLGCQIA